VSGFEFGSSVRNEYLEHFNFIVCIGLTPTVFWITYAFETGKNTANFHLNTVYKDLEESQERLIETKKQAAIHSVASGVTHEINSPLTSINLAAVRCQKLIERTPIPVSDVKDKLNTIISASDKIFTLTKGLNSLSRTSSEEDFCDTSIPDLLDEVVLFCNTKFKSSGILVELGPTQVNNTFKLNKVQISNALITMIEECTHTAQHEKEKWIRISTRVKNSEIQFLLNDAGLLVIPSLKKFIEDPFAKSEGIDKGSGLRIGVVSNILKSLGGSISLGESSDTCKYILACPLSCTQKDVS